MFGEDGVACFCTDEDLAAHRRLYNLEAYLRYMIRWELVGALGTRWFSSLGNIKKETEKTREAERELGVIDYDRRNPLGYTVAQNLEDLIDGNVVWPNVRDWMPRSDLLKAEFEVFRALRNKSAHLRRLTTRDLRSLERVEHTLLHCTARYRNVRREAVPVSKSTLPGVAAALKPGLRAWQRDAKSSNGRWADVLLRTVGSYVRVDARLRIGAFHPDAIARCIAAGGTDAFFACLDAPTGRLSCYISDRMEKDEADLLLAALRDFAVVGDPLEDADSPEFFDFVFPIHVELPAALRI